MNTDAGRPTRIIRIAEGADLPALQRLDEAAFPSCGLDARRADPGELEAGVEAGHIFLLESAGTTLAYLVAARTPGQHVYISGVAVRPDLQGEGLGGLLLDHLLHRLAEEPEPSRVLTVTSPNNARMLRMLFRRGFAACCVLRDHFGPLQHRLGCELLDLDPQSPSGIRRLPTGALSRVFRLMERQNLVIQALVSTPRGPAFELVPRSSRAAGPSPADFGRNPPSQPPRR